MADGHKIVVPYNYDVSALSTYKSVGAQLSSLVNEETPLLLSGNGRSTAGYLHPTTEVSVPYKNLNAKDGNESDGSDDVEAGLQLEPMLRPMPGAL